jgi:hypothetical protein
MNQANDMNDWSVEQLEEYVKRLSQDRNIQGLIEALNHWNPYMTSAAIKALGELGDKQAIDPLIIFLENSWEEMPRGFAIDALANFGDPKAIPVLHIRATSDDIDNRIRAIIALASLGDKQFKLFITPELYQRRNMATRYMELDRIMKENNVNTAPEEKQEKNISPKVDGASNQVKDLMSADISRRGKAISQVLKAANRQALDDVESAIHRLTNKENLRFYKPTGFSKPSQEAYNLLITLAQAGMFYDDPVFIQTLIPKIGEKNQELMEELTIIDQGALAIYQLLGIQMQIQYQVA